MAELLPLRPRIALPDPLWRHLVGDRLRRMRHARGETLADVARRAGVSVQYLSEVERGLKEASSEIVAAVLGALEGSLLDLTAGISDDLRAATTSAPAPAHSQVPAQTPARVQALALAA